MIFGLWTLWEGIFCKSCVPRARIFEELNVVFLVIKGLIATLCSQILPTPLPKQQQVRTSKGKMSFLLMIPHNSKNQKYKPPNNNWFCPWHPQRKRIMYTNFLITIEFYAFVRSILTPPSRILALQNWAFLIQTLKLKMLISSQVKGFSIICTILSFWYQQKKMKNTLVLKVSWFLLITHDLTLPN